MGIRPTNDPYGGVNPLIDKMIGNAYDIVKYVARYLKEIRYVAENMDKVYEAAQNMQSSGSGGGSANMIFLEGQASSGQLFLAPPPEVTVDRICGASVLAQDSNGSLMPPSEENWRYVIRDDGTILINTVHWSLENAYFKATLIVR